MCSPYFVQSTYVVGLSCLYISGCIHHEYTIRIRVTWIYTAIQVFQINHSSENEYMTAAYHLYILHKNAYTQQGEAMDKTHFLCCVNWYIWIWPNTIIRSRVGVGCLNDDVIKWKHLPRYWPVVGRIHRSSMDSPHKDQWLGPLMISLKCTWTNNWANNRDPDDLRRHRAHYDVPVMRCWSVWLTRLMQIKSTTVLRWNL